MAPINFHNVSKIFADGTEAIGDFTLQVADGELLVLVGPSGCGKSTLLRLLAGLDEVSRGEILIAGDVVNGQPPQQRNLAMVFQNYALYPHMSVQANLEFPLRMRGLAKKERHRRLLEIAQLLHLSNLLERRPKQLSGGQRQRVAMGRAIIREPQAFLMDEPLSNLDAKLRVQIRTEIAALQQRLQTTTLYVTHDQVEAMTLGHRVAVLNNGRLQQVATAQELYLRPANVFVAGFIGNPGMNIFMTRVQSQADKSLAVTWGNRLLPLPESLAKPQAMAEVADISFAGLRPEAFSIAEPGQIAVPVEVTSVEALGHEQLVYFRSEVEAVDSDLFHAAAAPELRSDLVARLPREAQVRQGAKMQLAVDLEQLCLFTASGAAV